MPEPLIPLRLGLQQRVLPSYRASFFDALARACAGDLAVFAGQPRVEESIDSAQDLRSAHYYPARNVHLLRGPLYLCWQARLTAWLQQWQPDVLVVEANPRYLATPGAVRWMHARRRPVIGWGLGARASAGVLAGLRASVRRSFLTQFDAVIAYSRQGADEYVLAGVPAERIFVSPNAAAPRPAGEAPERPAHFSEGQATLLFVGRLQPRKRIDLLLQACAALPDETRPRLWIVGDGPARAELEALADRVYPTATFFGAQYGQALERFFLDADLFVLPGTGGLAVQQAMSYGLPVLVAEGDGTQNDLVRPAAGWQVVPGSQPALLDTLVDALADPIRLRRMGRESFRVVRDEINIEKMVEGFAAAVRYAAALK